MIDAAAALLGPDVTIRTTDGPLVFELHHRGRCVSRAELLFDAEGRARTLATLNAVYTHPDLRGQGYARTLIRAIITALPTLGVAQCRLTCRPELRGFYAALGWQGTRVVDEMLLELPDAQTVASSSRRR